MCARSSSLEEQYAQVGHWKRIFAALPANVPKFDESKVTEEFFSAGDYELHLDRWKPDETPLVTLVVVHGAGGNGRLLAPYCQMAVEFGCEVVAPDLPGYGFTKYPAKSRITYECWRHVLSLLLENEAKREPPVVVFGLSMGGLLAYDVTARTKIPVGLVSTCFLDPQDPPVRHKMGRWSWMVDASLPLLTFTRVISDYLPLKMSLVSNMAAIANKKEIVNAIIADHRAGGNWMFARFLRTYLSAAPEIPPEEFDVCPVLLVHPGDDKWTPIDISRPFFEKISKVQTEVVILEGAGHFPVESPGFEQLRDAFKRFVTEAV